MQSSGEDDSPPKAGDESGREAFTRTGTLGVEEEFYVVDQEGYPTAGTDDLVYDSDPPEVLEGRLDHELFKCVIETQTPVIESVADVRRHVSRVRDAVVDHAADHGYRVAGAGLHPAARWRGLAHAEKPRYRSQLDRIQYPQHRNTTAGVHVHVGVDDADKATWIANAVRYYLPPILALSANSPFWNGYDTGLASARAKIFEALPNTGMPTRFSDFEAFQRFERRMLDTDSVRDRGELWYDVRPHTDHGTVEIRAPDGQRHLETVLGFVEYVHALVIDLAARYEDESEPHPPWVGDSDAGIDEGLRRELLDENKWRAIRHGHDASFLTPDGSGTVQLDEFVDHECDRLGVEGIRATLERDSGATRQRRVLRSQGFDRLRRDLLLS